MIIADRTLNIANSVLRVMALPFAVLYELYNVAVDRVDERGLVKVADFGLSRELIVQDYYRLCHSKTPVPVRWMAPESLSANVFTTMSDVVRSHHQCSFDF